MTNRDDISHQAGTLRRKTEEIALEKPAQSLDVHAMSAEDIQRVLHELRVHQIELEAQNEELRRAQAQIEAGRDRYYDLYDLAPVGYCTLSEQGLILEANLTAAKMLDAVRGDLIKQPISRFILTEDQDICYLHRKKLFETGEAQQWELRLVRPDGTLFWAYLTATAAQTEDGAPVCRVVIIDITERKQAESLAKIDEENLWNVADAMQETLSVMALNGTFLYANQKATRNMSGGKLGDIIGKNIRELIPKVQAESLIERYQSVYQSGEPFHQEIKIDLNTGDTWFFNTLKPIEYGNPPVPAVLSVSLDITKRKQMEDELQQSHAMLARTERIANVGSWEWDIEADRVRWSDELFQIFQRDPARGAPSFAEHPDIYVAEDMDRLRDAVQTCITKGAPYELELRAIRTDGMIRQCISRGQADYDGAGRIIRLVGSLQDITGHKQAENELRKRESHIRTLVNTIPDLIWLKDADGVYLSCNKRFERFFGASEADIIGKTDYDFVDKELADFFREFDRKAIAVGGPSSNEEQITFADNGHKAFLETIKSPMFDTDGKLIGILGIGREITDRKRAEEALREQRDFSESLIETAQVIILVLDTKGRIVRFNPYMEELAGYALDEVKGMDWFETFLTPEIDRAIKPIFQKTVADIHTSGNVNPIIAKDGRTILVEWHNKTLKDKDGCTVGILAVGQDITEREQAENHLRMAHEKLLTILDSIDSTVYVADLNTYEILFMNQKMITDFGGNKTGDICYSVFRKNSEPCQCCTNNQLIDKDGNPAGVCIWHDKNPVTGRYYINYDRAIEWTDGHLVRMQIATDITDLKNMEAQLQQAQKMEAIGTLAGGIAHDFNNILGAILGYAEMAQEDSPAGSILRQDIDQIVKAGHRARELVKQILAFSRQAETEHMPLQPAFIILEAIKMLRSSLPSTITIKQNIDMDAGLILASPTQIHQIVMNLGTNAFHAMEEAGGTLTISLEKKTLNERDIVGKPGVQSGDFVQLSVGDTGPGIAPELWDKILNPYFTTKEVGKGTGMGLAIIHGIVKSYGGWVSFQSQPGKDTVFQVLLPVMAEGTVVENTPEEIVQFGNERILFIDDEELLAEMGRSMLERLGYQVTVQSSSLQALTTFQNQPDNFDLVITDQTMPGMTGSDLARRILQIRPFMPIILCTGFSSIITEEKAKSLGIKGFAMKPLVRKSIAVLIREVLDGGRRLSLKPNI